MSFIKLHRVEPYNCSYRFVGAILLNVNNIILAKPAKEGTISNISDEILKELTDSKLSEINKSNRFTDILIMEGQNAERYTVLEDLDNVQKQLPI